MDVFKTQFEQVKKQLAALTASQKMLVVALLAVMGLVLVYWGKYAGSPEMVPLLNGQTLTDNDIGQIDTILQRAGIDHTVEKTGGGKVLVPAEKKNEALGQLMYEHALPSDTHSAFEEMSKSLTAFSTVTEREAVYTQALNKQMATVIATFPGVASATVVINSKTDRRIESPVPPSAMVSISTKAGADVNIKKLLHSAADGLSGAVSGLTPDHVSVIVNGQSLRIASADSNPIGMADELVERKERSEVDLQNKIKTELYPYILGLTVTVNVDVENRSTETESQKYDPKVVSAQLSNTSEDTNTSNLPAAGKDTGVGPNTGGINQPVSLNSGSGDGSPAGAGSTTSTHHTETAQNGVWVSSEKNKTTILPGKPTAVSAAVGVPLSYFQTRYRGLNPSATKDVAYDQLKELIAVESAAIHDKVAKTLGLKNPTDLVVDMYVDAPPVATPDAAAAGPSAVTGLITSHVKEIAVAALAVGAMLMMVLMVRKAGPVATVMTSAGPISIGADDTDSVPSSSRSHVPGAIATSGQPLDGMELADEDVHTAQMLEQVSTMVKENPDGAAALVKRWLSRP